jgi:hypothetical protein
MSLYSKVANSNMKLMVAQQTHEIQNHIISIHSNLVHRYFKSIDAQKRE